MILFIQAYGPAILIYCLTFYIVYSSRPTKWKRSLDRHNVLEHLILSIFMPIISWVSLGRAYTILYIVSLIAFLYLGWLYVLGMYILGIVVNPWVAWVSNKEIDERARIEIAKQAGKRRRRDDN